LERILERQLFIPEVGRLQHLLQLRQLSPVTRKAFAGRMRPAGRTLCRPALEEALVAKMLFVGSNASLHII